MLTAAGASYGYDSNGNQTSRGAYTFESGLDCRGGKGTLGAGARHGLT